MLYAIDRYQAGHEKEVRADEFFDMSGISSRLYCPECGEKVYYRKRGGAHPAHFYHDKKTRSSPECDKRVDGHSTLSLYERVGLPLFLTRNGAIFHLNIGFPAIGSKALERAALSKSYLNISCSHSNRTIYVDSVNFFENSLTMVPIDFVSSDNNYSIKFISTSSELPKEWSDYADGFCSGGAVFTYEETGGKKIRRGDSVSPGHKYYVVAPKAFSPLYQSIKVKYVGKLSVKGSSYCVYIMTIEVSLQDTREYNAVSDYLKNQFGIWLISTAPEIIPLWPPIVSQDVLIPISNSSKLYCAVSSGNECPNVYSYSECAVSNIPISEDEHGSKTIIIPSDMSSVTLSVDRKYVGREISIVRKEIDKPTFSVIYSLEKSLEYPISFDSFTVKDLSENLTVKSNARFELYLGSRDKTFQPLSIRSVETELPSRRGSVEIIMVVENGVINYYHCQSNISMNLNENIFVSALKSNFVGEMLPAPSWINSILTKCRNKGYQELYFLIMRFIHTGQIPVGALRYLSKIKNII